MARPSDVAGAHFRDAGDAWSISADEDPMAVAAAWLQFHVAQIIWDRLRDDRLSLKAFALQLGQSAEAQRKKLSGEQPVSLRDMLAWLMIAGAEGYRVLPRDDSELFPPGARHLLGAWRSGGASLPVFTAGPAVEWPSLGVWVETELAAATAVGRSHLLSAGWIRQQAIDWLTDVGVAPAHIRLLRVGAVECLRVGVVERRTIGFAVVRSSESEDPVAALEAAWRLRDAVRVLAAQSGLGVLVIVATDHLARGLIEEALPTIDVAPEAALGPFELDTELTSSNVESAWWTSHQVILHGLFQINRDDGLSVLVLPTEKIVEL